MQSRRRCGAETEDNQCEEKKEKQHKCRRRSSGKEVGETRQGRTRRTIKEVGETTQGRIRSIGKKGGEAMQKEKHWKGKSTTHATAEG